MRITCPACNASYDLPEVMLGLRQAVRCARCTNDWVPSPSERLPAVSDTESDGYRSGTLALPAGHLEDAAESAETASALSAGGALQQGQGVLPVVAEGGEQLSAVGNALHLDAPIPEHDPQQADEAWQTPPLSNFHPMRPVIGRGAWLGWVASLMLLCTLGCATVAWRGRVERVWPPSVRLYAVLGLTTVHRVP